MWPYGYTNANVPGDMTAPDHAALVHMGRRWRPQRLQARAGERPVHHARARPATTPTARTGSSRTRSRCRMATTSTTRGSSARPAATRTPSCTSPSGPGARWRSSASPTGRARCGAFDDDLEVARAGCEPGRHRHRDERRGWQRATSGDLLNGPKQLGGVPSGSRALRDRRDRPGHGQRQRPRWHDATSAPPRSTCPSTTGQRLFFRYVFAHGANSSSADSWSRTSRTPAARGRRPSRRRLGDRCRRGVAQRLRAGPGLEGPAGPHRFRGRRRWPEQPRRGGIDDVRITRGS